MEFKKTKFGNLDMYITSLAITGKDGQTRYFELKLYNDPRKLNNEKNLTKRVLPKSYIALTNSTLDCNGTALAGYKLGEFFTALGSQTKGALTDYARASQDMNISGNLTIKELNELVRNCSNSKSYSIVILDTGYEKQSVFNDFSVPELGEKENCYIIQAKNCESTKAVESFILDLIYVMQFQKPIENNQTQKNETMPPKPDDSQLNLSQALNASEGDLIVGN
ncbi:MAG: hypothetical protein A2444_04225 [Candidatus Staskawiczbacteria bacterium RIFOXYC2_FULL_37_19]|nr:MAG: hypothetical protein A2444_04225 [Candidatus Staskawiczbacteria bacterium RIFOXYC2_FULL_37_19]